MCADVATLRRCVRALTSFFDTREEGDVARLDPHTLDVTLRSTLDDAELHPPQHGSDRMRSLVVPPPDGLFEWRIRRDFVRTLLPGVTKSRLSETLAGPRTRRRFTVTLHAASDLDVRDRFARFRRMRLRAYAARIVRGFIAASAVTEAAGFRPASGRRRPGCQVPM